MASPRTAVLYERWRFAWPFGIALQEGVPNQRALRPLTAVRGERHVKRRAVSVSGEVREDGGKSLPLTRRKSFRRHRNQSRPNALGPAWGIPVYCPGGVRRTG